MSYSCNACKNLDTLEMVQCDQCNNWYHYSCVGVDDDIANQDWSCNNCTSLPVENDHNSSVSKEIEPKPTSKSPPTKLRQNDSNNAMQNEVASPANNISLLLRQLEEEKELKEKRDKEYIEKKYALLRSLGRQSYDVEQENIPAKSTQNQQKATNSLINNATQQKLSHLRAAPNTANIHQIVNEPFSYNLINATNFKSHSLKAMQQDPANPEIFNPATMSTSINNKGSFTDTPIANQFVSDTSIETQHLNKQQLAARQLMSKEQVIFSGQPEEWPLFISWFNSSTVSCGYTNIENLRRLQNCLKGDALEAVRCRLLLPEQVPGVIRTLRLLFGRPEIIINNLIEKIRKQPPPRVEKLQSIINFSLSVQNMCSVMEASELHTHLTNPCLLQELTEKLPPQLRLNWGCYRRSAGVVDLSNFSIWLSDVAHSACEVTPLNTFVSAASRTEKYPPRASLNVHQDLESEPQQETTRECPICSLRCKSVDLCQQFLNMNLGDKWNVVKRFLICRTCLRQHGRNRCYAVKVCGIDGCNYKHHQLLHKWRNDNTTDVQVNCHQIKNISILFKIVPVTLRNGKKQINTFAFLDDGSSISLMDADLAADLGVDGESQPLCLKWTANTHRTEKESKNINIKISKIGSNKIFNLYNIRTVSSLELPIQTVDADKLSHRYQYLKRIPIKSYSNAKPRILLGLDQWKLSIPLRSQEGIENQPVASKTRLGWAVYGPYTESHNMKLGDLKQKHYNYHICDCLNTADNHLNALFKDFIAIESAVTQNNNAVRSREDERAVVIVNNGISKDEKRFVVPLLWKYEKMEMPDSRLMAKRRLLCLEKRLSKDQKLNDNLNKQIEEYVQKKYARKLCRAELSKMYPLVWYLPIFPVVNPHKPNKVRIVWDAAATVNGISLNSMLLSGPDVVPSLISVLFRFRERRIGICADIREMFHQVCVKREDQHAQRFLWRNRETQEIEEYVMQVLTFGSTCSPFCAQFVKNTNASCYVDKYPRAVRAIIENHYVDDYLDSVDSEEEAVQLANDVMFIHKQAEFDIRNFMSNSKIVLHSLKEKAVGNEKSIANWHTLSIPEKILGMWWGMSTDTFSFAIKAHTLKLDVIANDVWPTKREFLKVLMSVIDPLGLIANFLVLLKIVLKDVWSSGIGWDEKIQPQDYDRWCKWKSYIPDIKNITINRPYLKQLIIDKNSSVQMHIFVDASEVAYSAVGYLRVSCGNIIELCLVAAKTKVAPMKTISIPRLELEAAVLGIRLARLITTGHSIDITEKYFWSDSKTVLSWINSDHRKYKQFVAFRVGEILEESDKRNWRWISSKINIADEATKWKSNHKFSSESRWFQGPSFLYETSDRWPKEFSLSEPPTEEIRQVHLHQATEVNDLVDIRRFSRWSRLLRSMAQVYRFVRVASKKTRDHESQRVLISADFVKAENILLRICQKDVFSEEIAILQTNSEYNDAKRLQIDKTSPLYKLSPYLDENSILRVRGRIDAVAGVPFSTKRPIILPKLHHITHLIIADYHRRFCHQYDETVVNELRQKFCIPRLRVLLKAIKRDCQLCKNLKSFPQPQLMGNLPQARLQPFTRPFSYIGIDYFGPLFVTVGRHSEKRWGVLITCMTVRAVHIEITCSLTTDSCIMALKRFIARRGWPVEINSDNGTNFRGASQELNEAVSSIEVTKISQSFVGPNLKWNFIPPSAPHMGVSWERLVRSVKQTLRHILPARNPSDELLSTMMAEVERIVNSRPLTYVPLDDEGAEALTPNHFLLGSSNGEKLCGALSSEATVLRKNWLTSEQYANRFWRRWVSEYLPDLTRRTKWYSLSRQVREGDIVIIVDPDSPRNQWPKGVVIKTIPGKDQLVRSAVVRTLTGVYTRPSAKLAILDIGRFSDDGKPVQGTSLPGGSVAKPGST